MTNVSIHSNTLRRPLELPCGAILKNRLAKSAMSDSLANGEGEPTAAQMRLYERWANGGVALSLIGEVQGDFRFPEKPGNLVLGETANQPMLHSLTRRAAINNSHLWVQLGHAGALSHPPISRAAGPSALDINGIKCREMSIDEVRELPHMFAQTAAAAKTVGFSGVQIHAAHGFLLSQFLSPLFNRRNDGYGGSIEARCRIIVEVIEKVRSMVGAKFPVGIKINSSDQLEGGLSEEDALVLVHILEQTSLDLIDLSGGTYFPGAKASSDAPNKGPYFFNFARQAKNITNIPLMLTGGFKSRAQALEVVASGAVDVVGLARAMVLDPHLAKVWLAEEGGDPMFPRFQAAPPGGITAWYTMRLTALGEDREDTFSLDISSAIRAYEERDALRCHRWIKKFNAN